MALTEKQLEYHRRWRLANPDKVAAAKERNREHARQCARNYYWKNREKCLERGQQWRDATKGKRRVYIKQYIAKNREKVAAYNAQRKKSNRAKYSALQMKRDAAKKRAIPAWANDELMELVYAEAAHRKLCVDHIVPIQGRNVCGLHVYYNTQLLTRAQNASKGNRFTHTGGLS